jgi:xanthine dehydrogenase small subunit
MSLYALYRNARSPDDETICQALSGNLCRCTGYRPILAAARRMYDLAGDTGPEREPDLARQLRSIRVTREKRLAAAGSSYVAPSSVAELARALAARPDAALLAGGTDLALRVTKGLARLPDIVYLGNVGRLARIARTRRQIEIGAAVSLTDAFEVLVAEYPSLRAMTRRFASPPVCNAGTLCGNIANGSPIGDTMPALICLDAAVVLQGKDGSRTLPLEAFYLGYQKKDLQPGEFVASVRVPRARAQLELRCYKIAKRYEQDISAVCGAFAIEVADGRVRLARVCFGGMAEVPRRAPACEQALAGSELNEAGIEPAIAALAADFNPISDFRASHGYRQRVAANLLRRLVAEMSAGELPTGVWNHAG